MSRWRRIIFRVLKQWSAPRSKARASPKKWDEFHELRRNKLCILDEFDDCFYVLLRFIEYVSWIFDDTWWFVWGFLCICVWFPIHLWVKKWPAQLAFRFPSTPLRIFGPGQLPTHQVQAFTQLGVLKMGDPQVTMGFKTKMVKLWMIWGYPYFRNLQFTSPPNWLRVDQGWFGWTAPALPHLRSCGSGSSVRKFVNGSGLSTPKFGSLKFN